MRMSIPGGIAACAIVVVVPFISVALLSTPAFAAKQSAVLAACKRTKGCWSYTDRSGGANGCSGNTCFSCNGKTCQSIIKAAGGSNVQRGPNAVVTTPKSARGSIPVQTGATAVINSGPVRPTGPSGSFHGKGR